MSQVFCFFAGKLLFPGTKNKSFFQEQVMADEKKAGAGEPHFTGNQCGKNAANNGKSCSDQGGGRSAREKEAQRGYFCRY